MRDLFYPGSVAVIGVSPKPTNLGRNIVANLVEFGFDGRVYAVGPSGGVILTRRIYRSVGDIPDHIDLAIIFTPARTVPGILEECGQKGIRWAIIETAGFREYGEEVKKLEAEILEVAERYNIRFIGPNCIGAINMENGLCVPFPRLQNKYKKGDVSIISQSGGVGLSAMNIMVREGIGLSKFVSVGNMLDVSAVDILEYLIEDEDTKLIFMYLESVRNGRRLMELARKAEKPILIFKANIGELGQTIAASHTASLSSDDKVVEAAFKQSGIIRIRDATTFGNSLKILELPPMRGKNLAIISRAGGHAVMAADACELSGFQLAEFPDSFLRKIEEHFRASVIRLTNPLDLGDLFDLDVYAQIVEQTLQLDNVDGVVFLHTSLGAEHESSRVLLERIMELVHKYDKPVALYISSDAKEVNYLKQKYSFPIFTAVVETIRALELNHRYCCQFQKRKDEEEFTEISGNKEAVRKLIEQAHIEKRDLLLSEAMDVLENYGVPTASSVVAKSVEDACSAANEMGYPVAIKVIAEQISHKSDVGGVQLNLYNQEAVAEAFESMMTRIKEVYPDAGVDGVLVQPMVTGGRELIVGGRQDPQFGPVVLVGLGGIFVEIFEEVVVRVTPISRDQAERMIFELRGSQILKGARGHMPSDIDSVVDAILRVSQLLIDFPEIDEVDINPLRVFHEQGGCRALDARMIIRHNN